MSNPVALLTALKATLWEMAEELDKATDWNKTRKVDPQVVALTRRARQIVEAEDDSTGWVDLNLPFSDNRLGPTFKGLGLRRAGVQIEVDGNHYLLGDVNTLGSQVNNEVLVKPSDIVTRYRVLLSRETLGSA